MRTRQIHKDFWTSESISELDFFERLTFIGLWGMADREGLLLNRPKRIAATLFPYDNTSPEDIAKVIHRLKDLGIVTLLERSGHVTTCIYIVKFLDYQHIHPHEAQSKLACHYITGHDNRSPRASASASASASTSGGKSGGPKTPPIFCPSDAQKKTISEMAEERGVKLKDILKNLGLHEYQASDVTDIMAKLKSIPKKDRPDAPKPTVTEFAEVQNRLKDGGWDEAMVWIKQQNAAIQPALRERLRKLEESDA